LWGKGVDIALYIALAGVIAANLLLVVVAIAGAINREELED